MPLPAEARVTFHRGPQGEIAGFIRRPIAGGEDLEARRVRLWSEADLAFKNGDVTLKGTPMTPAGAVRHPAMVLVHGSGPLDELRAEGVGEPGIADAPALTRLTHAYARSGSGWDKVEAAVAKAQGAKNRAIWEAALKAGGNRDRTLRVFPKGLKRFVPGHAETITEWVPKRAR